MAENKTNVMRILSQKKISYTAHEYPHGDTAVDGITVAKITGLPPEKVFKTLVCRGASKAVYVFCIPVSAELDLKKAAKAAGEKSVAMVPVSEITGLTNYVRGGCSPVGMKKLYPTFFHRTVDDISSVVVSAGKIGYQVELDPNELLKLINAAKADIITEV